MTDKRTSIQEAAQMSVNGKPSHNQAYDLVHGMLEGLDKGQSLEEHKDALIQLYAFFMPKIPSQPKTDFKWLAMAAAGREDVRDYLRFVYVPEAMAITENGDASRLAKREAVATDGHRMHVVRGVDWESGWYNPNTGDRAQPPKSPYPDYRRPIPEDLTHRVDCAGWKEWEQHEFRPKTMAIKVGHDRWVNRSYLAEALTRFIAPVIWFNDSPGSAIVILENGATVETAERLSVIMPLRL